MVAFILGGRYSPWMEGVTTIDSSLFTAFGFHISFMECHCGDLDPDDHFGHENMLVRLDDGIDDQACI